MTVRREREDARPGERAPGVEVEEEQDLEAVLERDDRVAFDREVAEGSARDRLAGKVVRLADRRAAATLPERVEAIGRAVGLGTGVDGADEPVAIGEQREPGRPDEVG